MALSGLVGWLLIGGALLMLGLAAWIYGSGKNARFREQVAVHFKQVLPRGSTISGIPPGQQETFWHRLRVRGSIYAGFELEDWHFVVIPLVFLLFGLVGWVWLSWAGALLLFSGAVLIIGFLLPYLRLRRRQAQITEQVPMFIDQVLRSLGSGRSVEGAIRLATEESKPPLRNILDRVVRATDLGADMPETLSDAAKLHGLREMSLIALAMRISNSYGSSPKEMLQSVVQMIRQRELAQRELAAMTGETRISAWVLSLTPISLAGYMVVMNPNYLNLMLQSPSGKTLLMTALGFQVAGVLILWRMLKSI
ncbi:MAG TPA: type II secretion system F family protein [Methylophilaceae bacterium]|jgi:tight adherence protein B|nr:type II secretion system F family protein [Methylophilaceae bacterium]